MKASEHGGDVPDSVEHWSYNAPGRELWLHDYFATKDQAVAAGRAYYGGDAFKVGRFVECEVDPPDADDVIETMCCRMSDTIPGDLAELFIENSTQESRDELSEAIAQTIADWLTKHGEWPSTTRVVDIETIGPVEGGGFLRLDLFGHDDNRCVDAVIGGVIFPHYETRGLVRGLCAALRVDLVEPDGTAAAGERASAA